MAKKDVISTLGYGGVVLLQLKEGKSPQEVADSLGCDDKFTEKLAAIGRSRVGPADIATYAVNDLIEKTALLDSEMSGKAGATLAAARAADSLEKTMVVVDQWGSIAQRSLGILEADLDKFEDGRRAGTPDKDNPFPYGTFESTRKAVMTSMEAGRIYRNDPKLSAIINAKSLTLRSGISQEELHEILFAVGRELGISEQMVMDAHVKAIVNRKRRKHAIDAEAKIGEVSGEALNDTGRPILDWDQVGSSRTRNFAKAIESSLGMGPA